MDNKELISLAIKAMENAYTPYSNFEVGAALLTENHNVYLGCNIENAAFSPTNCAERTAFFKAISEGERSFKKIAVVGGVNGALVDYVAPCGVCRQVMTEFCDENFTVILAKSTDDYTEYKLCELLPLAFSNEALEDKL